MYFGLVGDVVFHIKGRFSKRFRSCGHLERGSMILEACLGVAVDIIHFNYKQRQGKTAIMCVGDVPNACMILRLICCASQLFLGS